MRERAVGARLDQHVAECGRLDRSGDDGSCRQTCGQPAQERVLRAAADDVDDLDRRARRAPRPRRSCGHRRAASESMMRAGDRGRCRRDGIAPAGDGRGDAGRHVAGCDERRVVDVEDRSVRSAGRRLRPPRSRRRRRAGWFQARTHSWSNHKPPTLRRKRMRPSTPPSFVKFAVRGIVGHDRIVELEPDERPRPARHVGEAAVRCRHRDDGGGGVVRSDRRDDRRPRQSDLPRTPRVAVRRERFRVVRWAKGDVRRRRQRRAARPPRLPFGRRPTRSSSRWCTRCGARRSARTRAGRGAARCVRHEPNGRRAAPPRVGRRC